MRTPFRLSFVFGAILALGGACVNVRAEGPAAPLRVGYIGSLSGFAASYGKAVLEGVQLAADEVRVGSSSGMPVDLFIEDDRSETSASLTAYRKLRSVDKVNVLITGSWWVRSIVKVVEQDRIPFLSCETVYDEDAIFAPNYFTMGGDLRDWVRVLEPAISRRGLKRAAMIKYVSGFSTTLEKELRRVFSTPGREFAGSIQYNDIDLSEATAIVTKLKALRPDAVYIDGQPAGLANAFRKLHEQGVDSVTVLTHSAASDVLTQKLFDPAAIADLYFSKRETYQPEFERKFEARYGRKPELHADLGYYSMRLAALAALSGADPVAALQKGELSVDGIRFNFDEHNVFKGMPEDVWHVQHGSIEPVPSK